VIFGGKKSNFFSHRKTWLATVAEGGFQMFHSAFRVKPEGMHLAAWLCSRVKIIGRDRGDLPEVCCLFYLAAALITANPSGGVRTTDVMVNRVQISIASRIATFFPVVPVTLPTIR